MHYEHKEIELAFELVSGQFEFLEDSKASSSLAKNGAFKEKKRRNRSMKRRLLINGRDEALIDRNGAIISHPFDQLSRIRMRPRLQVKGCVV